MKAANYEVKHIKVNMHDNNKILYIHTSGYDDQFMSFVKCCISIYSRMANLEVKKVKFVGWNICILGIYLSILEGDLQILEGKISPHNNSEINTMVYYQKATQFIRYL